MNRLEQELVSIMHEDDLRLPDGDSLGLRSPHRQQARQARSKWRAPALAAAAAAAITMLTVTLVTNTSQVPPTKGTSAASSSTPEGVSRASAPTTSTRADVTEPTDAPDPGELGGLGACGVKASTIAPFLDLGLSTSVQQLDSSRGVLTLTNTGNQIVRSIFVNPELHLVDDRGVIVSSTVALALPRSIFYDVPPGEDIQVPFHIETADCGQELQSGKTYAAVIVARTMRSPTAYGIYYRSTMFSATVGNGAVVLHS